MKEVIERFDFYNTIAKLDESDLLFLVPEQFRMADLLLAPSNPSLSSPT